MRRKGKVTLPLARVLAQRMCPALQDWLERLGMREQPHFGSLDFSLVFVFVFVSVFGDKVLLWSL